MNTYRSYGLSSNSIKLIATISMVIDHIGAIILFTMILNTPVNKSVGLLSGLYILSRAIGRIAFPLFCYQLVIGFYKSTNRTRYIVSLIVLTLISEIPFDLAVSGQVVSWEGQNVILTLLLGMITMCIIEKLELMDMPVILEVLVALAACLTAWVVRCDYSFTGVVLILGFYYIRLNRSKLVLPFIAFMLAMSIQTILGESGLFTLEIEVASFLAIPIIERDNYIRSKNKLFKYLGYLFYPAHFLILLGINTCLIKQ